MDFKGRFRTVRHKDHAVPDALPRPLLGSSHSLDVRIWAFRSERPLLLATAPKKTGSAVQRNRFRRRARMAFLKLLRELGEQAPGPCVVWVRPSRRAPAGCRIPFQDIEGQLRLALRRFHSAP